MLQFIDTHCHFDFPPFAHDEVESIARAAREGVTQIIVPATEADNFPRVLAPPRSMMRCMPRWACIR